MQRECANEPSRLDLILLLKPTLTFDPELFLNSLTTFLTLLLVHMNIISSRMSLSLSWYKRVILESCVLAMTRVAPIRKPCSSESAETSLTLYALFFLPKVFNLNSFLEMHLGSSPCVFHHFGIILNNRVQNFLFDSLRTPFVLLIHFSSLMSF